MNSGRVFPAALTHQGRMCYSLTMRYEVREETTKNGRKTETQWVIFDTLEQKAFARFATQEQAQGILDRWYAAQSAAEANAQ